MSTPALRLVVAGDQEATCIGLRIALEQAGCVALVGAWGIESAVEVTLRERPDVCLIDVVAPGAGSLAAIREIKAVAPEVRVVLLSAICDELVLAALRAGADGFLPKNIDPMHLAATLRGVADGEAALPRRLVSSLIAAYRHECDFGGGGLIGRLTAREREIVELLLEDVGTGEVAYRLGINTVTVRRHISAIVRKSGTASRSAAIGVARAERKIASALAGVQSD